jgi:hypothetical protein
MGGKSADEPCQVDAGTVRHPGLISDGATGMRVSHFGQHAGDNTQYLVGDPWRQAGPALVSHPHAGLRLPEPLRPKQGLSQIASDDPDALNREVKRPRYRQNWSIGLAEEQRLKGGGEFCALRAIRQFKPALPPNPWINQPVAFGEGIDALPAESADQPLSTGHRLECNLAKGASRADIHKHLLMGRTESATAEAPNRAFVTFAMTPDIVVGTGRAPDERIPAPKHQCLALVSDNTHRADPGAADVRHPCQERLQGDIVAPVERGDARPRNWVLGRKPCHQFRRNQIVAGGKAADP